MALVLVKEDGSGMADANTYAAAADGDAYHEGHLYATAWTGATATYKAAALVMATRLMDATFRFNGFKRMATQALQWPRRECRDPDIDSGVQVGALTLLGPFLDETKVPPAVLAATCELARELLEEDRSDDPASAGLKTFRLEGALRLDFDAKDKPPVVPRLVQQMLNRFGEYGGLTSGNVRLIRT